MSDRKPKLIFARVGDRLGSLLWMRTIKSRLYLAFGLAAGMIVAGALFAFLAAANLSATLVEIVSQSIPATVESFRLSEDTNSLVGSIPRLLVAESESQRTKVAGEIAVQAREMQATIERLRVLDPSQSDEIATARQVMDERLNALSDAVAARIRISDQRRASVLAVRKAHEDLLEAITPAIDDANFDLMTKGQASETRVELDQSIDALRRLLEVQADVNLLSGQLIEASLVTDIASLPPLRDLIASSERDIYNNLIALPDSDQRGKIAALYHKLAAFAADSGIIDQRMNELKGEQDAQNVHLAALDRATKLRTAVGNLIGHEDATAQALSAHVISQIKFGQIMLIVFSVVALSSAGLIAWLYVGRNVVGRLTLLIDAMQRIAKGEAKVAVPVGGQDEIAGMAKALIVFRKAMEEVTTARQGDSKRAEQSETRRREIENATQSFEREVSEIAQSLDEASKTMDKCANVMAEAAEHNQTQASATAAASEQATANVKNVAMSAEEIAQSVEEISSQASSSAVIARQATDEAKTIIGTVERLVVAVGQINNVSNLIRDVAAQTNLLALNATIEAARAGVAGRGFAVVAQEVKSLASQTEKATGDITRQISEIEITTSSVVQAMKAIAETIGRLDSNATDISVAVQQQDAVSKEIARNASAAADRTRAVSANVEQVSHAAIRTGEIATSVLNAGSELAAKAGRLRTEVDLFLAQVRVA